MASRKTSSSEPLDVVEVFNSLVSFEPTQADPVSTIDLADDNKWDHTETFKALAVLADAELVDSEGRGFSAEWWITTEDISEEFIRKTLETATPSAPVKATKVRQTKAEKATEARERLEYATRAAESQEPGAQHLHPMEDARPVIAQDVPELTDKVDTTSFSLSVDTLTDKPGAVVKSLDPKHPITPQALPEIKGLDQFVDAETGDMVYESSIEKNGLKLDEPAEIPPCPAGVNANVWDLANTAITQTARDYWLTEAKQAAEEYAANNGQPAPF